MTDQELEQQVKELILRYQCEDEKFLSCALMLFRKVRKGQFSAGESLCDRLEAEIRETKKNREEEVENLFQGTLEAMLTMLREVRERAVRLYYPIEGAARARHIVKRACSHIDSAGQLVHPISVQEFQGMREVEIGDIHAELDAFQEALPQAQQHLGIGRDTEGVAGKGSKNPEETFRHTPDYISVNLRGQQFTLSPRQAEVVQLLHEAYKNGTPDLHHEHIKARLAMGKSAQVRGRFREDPDTWKCLIATGRKKGTLRLNI